MGTRAGFHLAINHLFTKIHLPLKQGIHRLHQHFNRTVIVAQAVLPSLFGQHIGTGFVIGQHVAATEAVNRLFRISDHNHAALHIALLVAPDPRQHIVLILVGILKFIHQNQGITGLHKLGKA